LDFHLNAAKIDCTAAWDGKIVRSSIEKFNTFEQSMDAAREVLEQNIYRDVHCWVFTPKSFAALLGELVGFGLIDFACERFWDTEPYTFEFLVALRPSGDKDSITESWQSMADGAQARGVEPAAILKADHQKIEAIHRDLAVSRDDAYKLKNDLAAVTELLEAERRKTFQMEHSRSWKITYPVTALAEMLWGGSRTPAQRASR
jgi:hypothetical protein